ncbi:uncharacterized protein [Ptychodera flava]|uniref:uncharacterized protein n=1 Tax=Ptychodera flava TaxID=63121 RepID=UPI00396AB122
MRSEINELKEENRVTGYDLDAVSQKLDEISERLDSLENDTDRLESFSRRDNIRLYGIQEEQGESFNQCKSKVVDILNENVKSKVWNDRDVVRAHRVSVQWKDQPRLIVVKFHHFSDKLLALKERPILRDSGIGIGNDLTKCQRKTLTELRKQECEKESPIMVVIQAVFAQ